MSSRFDEPFDLQIHVPVIPHAARIYDFCLGGRNHFSCDRTAAQRIAQVAPSIPKAYRANREFMARAVQQCTQEQGIRQFIDIGPGFSAGPSITEIAAAIHPDVTVAEIDNDAEVLSHRRARGNDASIIEGDIRQPIDILSDRRMSKVINWRDPVGLVMGAVLHHVCDNYDPHGIVRVFREVLAPGSVVILSHLCSNGMDPKAVAAIEAVYSETSSPLRFRTHEQISRFFTGLELVSPGVVQVQHWPDLGTPALDLPLLGGVGRIPWAA